MTWQTLIDPASLRRELGNAPLALIDCRFDLTDPGSGERAYLAGHIPGAHYAHLDRDLSDLGRTGRGRHPLPDSDAFCASLERWAAQVGWEVLLNRSGTTFRKLADADKTDLNQDKAIALMLDQPSMIKRPVLDVGGELLVGFKPDAYAAKFS